MHASVYAIRTYTLKVGQQIYFAFIHSLLTQTFVVFVVLESLQNYDDAFFFVCVFVTN